VKRLLFLLAVLIFSFLITYSGPVRYLELKLIDSRFRVRGEEMPPDEVVVVAIDDETYSHLNMQFPYPRSIYAKLLENLKKAGVRGVGFDIEFDVSDREPSNDSIFSEAIKNMGNVVLATKLIKDGEISPIPLLKNHAKTGFGNVIPDRDGVIRRYLFRSKKGYQSIALSLAEIAGKKNSRYIDYLYYYGPAGSFKTYPMWTILDDENFLIPDIEDSANDVNVFNTILEHGELKGKIVLVGVTINEFHDIYPTPFNVKNGVFSPTSGVEIHATALGNILKDDRLKHLPPAYIWGIIILLILPLLFLPYGRTFLSIGVFAFLLLTIFILDFYLFVRFRYLIPVTPFITTLLLTYISGTTLSIIESQKEKRLVRNIFQRYVPGVIMDEILKNPGAINLGGEKKILTVMFTDIEGFTSFSEGKDPSIVVNLINKYLGEMTEIIFKHRGTVDKYEGDAIMAVFGAPYYYEEHPLEAVLAALEMNERVKKMWEEGFPRLKTRFGINTGLMIVGNMGTEERMDYTVIGDSVNIASRLEGANKFYGTDILVGENTYEYAKDKIPMREIDLIRVKGKKEPVHIYEPLGFEWNDRLKEFMELFHRALYLYRSRNWDEAEKLFKHIYRTYHDRASYVFIERINIFKTNPPPKDWDGVFTMKNK